MKFPYRQYATVPSPLHTGNFIFRPEIPLRVIGSTGDARLRVLVDTGADITLLPRGIGEAIGADMDERHGAYGHGVGGYDFLIIPGKVELELTDDTKTYSWVTTVGFVSFDNSENEVAVLGHGGGLDHLIVTFDSDNNELVVKPRTSFKKRSIQ